MIKKSKPLKSSPAVILRRVNSSPVGDLRKFEARRNQRLKKLRSLNYTCRTKTTTTTTKIHVSEDVESETKKITVFSFSEINKNDVVSMSERNNQPSRYGVVSVIGKRSEMEDAVRAELGFVVKGGEKFDFFGVYDGHGGVHVAGTCRERLHEILAAEMIGFERESSGEKNNGRNWERVMEGCFGKMDDEVRGNAAARTVGATAVTAVVAEEEVVVANCGDCRAVLCRDGVALPLSIDHKPNRPDELERIEAAGGKVINWNGYRVLGVLATSRSIGDQYLSPFVISMPEVTVTKRSDKDEFLILASDGLWDVISNEVACKVVKKCLIGKINRKFFKDAILDCNNRTSMAAAVLAELAMAWGSRDNISVIVVELRKP